jgi:hypothetical protein
VSGACGKVTKLYRQGKYNCVGSKTGRSLILRRSGRKRGKGAMCKILLIGTVNCLDLMNRCRRVKSKRGREYCAKKSASCKGLIKRYKQNQNKCFG